MATIKREFVGSKESILGIRTISREIKDGKLVHKRMVRGECFDIERQSGPSFDRIASGLYLESIPGEESTRVPSLFSFARIIPREGRRDDRREVKLKVRVEAVIRTISNEEHLNLRLHIPIIGSGVEVDYGYNEISPWKNVEIEYLPEHRSGMIWFMEETIEPLPVEILTFDEVYSILHGRLGAVFQVYDPKGFKTTKYRIAKEGDRLVDGLKYPVEYYGGSIAVSFLEEQEKPGLIISHIMKPCFYPIHLPDRGLPHQRPYLLANGEIHLTSYHGLRFTFFPPETA